MEESAPKRRRISPRTSAAASSRDATPQAQAQDPAPRPRSRRPSFASPTKASLARYNPGVLDRRRSSSPAKASASVRPSTQRASIGSSQPAPAENFPASEPTPHDDEPTRRDLEAITDSTRSIRTAGGGMAMAPRRSSGRPIPRPLPPPGPEGDDEFYHSTQPARRRPTIFSPDMGTTASESQEPDLPPVTSDPISSTPPKGIHSSPSRWRERTRQKKTSPLKPPPSRPEKPTRSKPSASRGLFDTDASRSQGTIRTDASTSAARNVSEFDPNATKKKERDALLEEISKLRQDLQLVERENERIRFMQTSGRVLAPTDEDVVRDIVEQHLMPRGVNAQQRPSQQLLKMALDPKSLLPFGKPSKPVGFVPDEADNWSSIKSHHPVALSAEQEAPYLELFSSFHISSTIAMLPSTPEHELRQRYSIKLKSKTPPGLFNARVEMTVDATDLSILELDVPALEPAARFELMPFIDKIRTGDCNRSMQRNIGLISWAMGEWYRVATHRGLLWAQLDKELSVKEELLSAMSKLRARKSRRTQDDEDGTDQFPSCTRAELIRFMGQQVFDLEIPSKQGDEAWPTVRLEWRIGFDWTGEAQSKIGVKIGVPGEWHQQDQRGALGKIPKLFEELVEEGEKPAFAAQTIVALLMGE